MNFQHTRPILKFAYKATCMYLEKKYCGKIKIIFDQISTSIISQIQLTETNMNERAHYISALHQEQLQFFTLTLKVPEKLQLYGHYVHYVVHICDFGMLRVKKYKSKFVSQ